MGGRKILRTKGFVEQGELLAEEKGGTHYATLFGSSEKDKKL